MDLLENIWEAISVFFASLMQSFEKAVTSVFGSANARVVKKLHARIDAINALESTYESMTDEQLREQTRSFRQRLDAGETLDDILVEAFAVCREGGKRFLGMRHYDVQLMGGMVLHSGAIAEMVTGEGKTLVATLPTYLNALSGLGVHVVTVNDYLARRDMEWMGPLYTQLGLTVGAIQNSMGSDERQKAYACDITYGTNNEFGFDYLRDNMRRAARDDKRFPKSQQQSQGRLNYAVIDEVDNILIDEARTPLIISGPAHDNPRKYADADRVARLLKEKVHFEVNEKDHNVGLTDEGVREAERLAGVESFYTAGNMEWPHLIDNALKAHYLYKRDVRYVVKEGRVIIVDEFTGRLMDGRQWSDGLHQAVEAKEGVKIKEETQTLATITLQNFFKLYNKLSGMTGTAMTEAGEFWKIYKLDVVAIPTNRVLQRLEFPDLIYMTVEDKYRAIAHDIERTHRWDVLVEKDDEHWGTIQSETEDGKLVFQPKGTKEKQVVDPADYHAVSRKGRPILVGTTSIEKSELLSDLLQKRGIGHEVLNAKYHQREAEIVAQAGRKGAVTIATNMAGRGTDIVLGGNPETMVWAILQDKYETRLDVPRDEWDRLVEEISQREKMKEQGEELKAIGGLHVIGTERHDARRIDLQLRGRCGRQGDPGSSRFYLSLQDDLMRIFAGPWVEKIFRTMGMQDGEAIESKAVTRRIEAAQKKVEEKNFEIRKSLLEYDEVMDEQRKRVYTYRQQILDGANCKDLILDMIGEQAHQYVHEFLHRDYGRDTFSAWVSSRLANEFESRDFRNMDFDEAAEYAIHEAERMAESQIHDAVEENLPLEEGESEWNWSALAKFANARWGFSLRDRDLKKVGRDGVNQMLMDLAHEAIRKIDLEDGRPFLEPDFGTRSVIGWARHKFDFDVTAEELADKEPDSVVDLVREKANEKYEDKEAAYPVMAAILRFSTKADGGSRLNRDGLITWARDRFDEEISEESVKSMQREEVRDFLVQFSRRSQVKANAAAAAIRERIDEFFTGATPGVSVTALGADPGNVASLLEWMNRLPGIELDEHAVRDFTRDDLLRVLSQSNEDQYRPEIRRMERELLLQLIDSAWKDHLLAMDHLRSAVGLVGYAQVDPKVEYKREGMRLFEKMWSANAERITDLIFRMEQLDEGFVGSTWVETEARHEDAPAVSGLGTQEVYENASGENAKTEPIRNRTEKVGRNAPCPCGSGKKYKNCCMRIRS